MLIATERFSSIAKLRLIEQFWDARARIPEDIESPMWHADALREAENAAAAGEAGFLEWNQAKE